MFGQSRNCLFLLITFATVVGQGCSSGDGPGGDAGVRQDGGGDAQIASYPPIADPVAYLATDAHYLGYADLVLEGNPIGDSVIDTTEMTIDGLEYPREDGEPLVFDSWEVSPVGLEGAPDLAILHVRSFAIPAGETVRARGHRPLVILAESIAIEGILDAGGHGQEPGAGGRPPGMGYVSSGQPGTAGQDGSKSVASTEADGGGGGAAHVAAGGNGGSSYPDPPDCGSECGLAGSGASPLDNADSLSYLIGGSGGGSSSYDTEEYGDCFPGRGGAGGGAVHLFATSAITVGPGGGINVGGGGGEGGHAYVTCPAGEDPRRDKDTTGGGGGGSGGTIHLQASRIEVRGVLAANGGGGGGGAGREFGPEYSGQSGQDGLLGTTAAAGGAAGSPDASAGGAGGALLRPAEDGEAAQWNAGGGGGGTGRISIQVATTGTYEDGLGIFSPEPQVSTYEPGGE